MPLIHSVIRAPAMCQFRTTRSQGPGRLVCGPDLGGSHASFQGLEGLCVGAAGERITLTLCFSHPSFPVCICLSLSLCVLFPTPVFIFYSPLLFGGVWPGFPGSPRVVPPRLQNSSSSASSEASETCQSVSECSSPTSVSSGSTMGAWASTEKVTDRGPPPRPRSSRPPRPLLLPQAQEPGNSKSTPRAWGRDEAEGFPVRGVWLLNNDREASRGSRAMGNSEV